MFIPEDVLIQILLRLPPKSMSRFKCVSKSWQAMIDSDEFMPEYLQLTYTYSYSSSNHCLHLISQTQSYDVFPISFISLLFSESEDEEAQLLELKGHPGVTELLGDVSDPPENTWYSYGVSIPINGIYCVSIIQTNPPRDVERYKRLVRAAFWNPGVRQFHVLPPIPRPAMLDHCIGLQPRRGDDDELLDPEDVDVRNVDSFMCGFVFEPASQDYNFFSITQHGNHYDGSSYFVCFHLYSLSSNSRQELHPSQITFPPDFVRIGVGGSYLPFHPSIHDRNAVPLNGSCHWLYCDFERAHLLSFDIVNNAFDETIFPHRVFGYEPILTIVDGYLAIAGPPPVAGATDFDFRSDQSINDVSVMKEYGVKESWMKAYRITLKSPGRCLGIIKDKLFVKEVEYGWVVSYRLGAHQDDYHEYGHVPFEKFDILPLEGSLIPIHPINQNQ